MKGKVIRNIILLLIIPLIITFGIIGYNSINNSNYSSIISYEKEINEPINNEEENSEFNNSDKDIIYNLSYNYTFMMFTAIGLVIIFSIFYFYLTKKKQW
ncbi:MAG: hypothetical protein IIZ40_03070 [Bacilli bacterium]|nr:hypothetical protein [Bacilli bacterium]